MDHKVPIRLIGWVDRKDHQLMVSKALSVMVLPHDEDQNKSRNPQNSLSIIHMKVCLQPWRHNH